VRIYEPNKNANLLNEVLKELYILRQAIDYGSSNVDARLKMVDDIRGKLVALLDEKDKNLDS
jgi:hypothetical protein